MYLGSTEIGLSCLAFEFSNEVCSGQQLSVAMWVRMTGGNGTRRVFATGSYTNSTDGPGILMLYHERTENLQVGFIIYLFFFT